MIMLIALLPMLSDLQSFRLLETAAGFAIMFILWRLMVKVDAGAVCQQ